MADKWEYMMRTIEVHNRDVVVGAFGPDGSWPFTSQYDAAPDALNSYGEQGRDLVRLGNVGSEAGAATQSFIVKHCKP